MSSPTAPSAQPGPGTNRAPAPKQTAPCAPPAGDSLEARLFGRREEAAWFRALSAVEQDAFRDVWRREADAAVGRGQHRSQSIGKASVRGAACFLLGALMFAPGGWLVVAVAVSVGAAAGSLWALLRYGPMRAGVLSAIVFAVLVMVVNPNLVGFVYGIVSVLVVGPLMYAAWLSREMKESDGLE